MRANQRVTRVKGLPMYRAAAVATVFIGVSGCGGWFSGTQSPSPCGGTMRCLGSGDRAVRYATVTGYLAIYGGVLFTPASGDPQVGGTVRWTNSVTGRVFNAPTKTKGIYAIELPPGTYRVVAGNGRGWPMGSCGSPTDLVTLTAGEHLTVNVRCEAI